MTDSTITDKLREDVSKLPKWAQALVRCLEQQRDEAIKALNEHVDNQTVSPIYYDDLICIEKSPVSVRRYVQTYKMTFEFAGVRLDVMLPYYSPSRRKAIELQFGGTDGRCNTVALIPAARNAIRLVTGENVD